MDNLNGVYAFIRIKNEIGTIASFFENIKGLFECGVIGYDPENYNDGSGDFIDNFLKENSGFKSAYYPFPVYRPYGAQDKIDICNRLDTYYNHVLAAIPDNTWFLKADADHYYDSELLNETLTSFDSAHLFAYRIILLNVAVYSGKVYVTKKTAFYWN